MRYLIITLLLFSGCSLFEKDEPAFSLNGKWSAFDGVALAGHCCQVSITLFDDDGVVTANGEVIVPGNQVGTIITYPVTGSGTFDGDNLGLSLQAGIQSAMFTAHSVEGQWYDMEADFTGFGHSAESLPFYKTD